MVTLVCACTALFSVKAYADTVDARFLVELSQKEAVGLDIQSATELALPILWKRVVPSQDLERANALKAVTSLVLQFKSVKYGAKITFNPSQVRNYLVRHGMTMIPEQPYWDLKVSLQGFADADEDMSRDLLNYAHGIADESGFRLGSRGKKLYLTFSPAVDVSGEAMLHVDVEGAFSADLLSHVDIQAEGFDSYQLQGFLNQVLREIRDAYSLGVQVSAESSNEIQLMIQADHTLSTQVMFEQALSKRPEVLALVPALLHKSRRLYRLQLRDGDDKWLVRWFKGYGLTATRKMDGNTVQWLVQ